MQYVFLAVQTSSLLMTVTADTYLAEPLNSNAMAVYSNSALNRWGATPPNPPPQHWLLYNWTWGLSCSPQDFNWARLEPAVSLPVGQNFFCFLVGTRMLYHELSSGPTLHRKCALLDPWVHFSPRPEPALVWRPDCGPAGRPITVVTVLSGLPGWPQKLN